MINGPPATAAEAIIIATVPDTISSRPRLCSRVVGVGPSTPVCPLRPSPTQTLAAPASLPASHRHPVSRSRRPQVIRTAAQKFVCLWLGQIRPCQFTRLGHQQRPSTVGNPSALPSPLASTTSVGQRSTSASSRARRQPLETHQQSLIVCLIASKRAPAIHRLRRLHLPRSGCICNSDVGIGAEDDAVGSNPST
ncbi:hypothetical protein ACLOJK_018101 [Asimina triloba]